MAVRRIRKVKFSDGKIEIHWEMVKTPLTDPAVIISEQTLKSADSPAPELLQAITDLRLHVANLLEQPAEWGMKFVVTGVSFSHAHNIMGAVVTGKVAINGANSPWLINTPHLPSESYNGIDDPSPTLSEAFIPGLMDVARCAEHYLDGERAQGSLFMGEMDGVDSVDGVDGEMMRERTLVRTLAMDPEIRQTVEKLSSKCSIDRVQLKSCPRSVLLTV